MSGPDQSGREIKRLQAEIDSLKKHLAQAQESEKLHRLILANIRDAVVLTDEDGNITFVCPNTHFIFGYSDEEIRAYEHVSKLIGEDMVSFPIGSEEQNIELELDAKDGEKRWVLVGIKPVDIFENKVLFTFHEITEVKKLQKGLRQAEKLEAVGTASARIAHDFNNLLAIISGSSELALEELPERSSLQETINDIKTAAQKGRDVVDQLLSFTKKTVVPKEPTRIDKIAVDFERFLRLSTPDGIEARLYVANDLAPVMADPTQITQILMNLCQNSFHAMKDKGGVLTVSLSNLVVSDGTNSLPSGVGPGKYVKMSVQDTGCGIEPEAKDRIFDPYFTTKKADEGTGLGLAIIYGIVKDHNGSIAVESEPGKGSVFDVYIPQCA